MACCEVGLYVFLLEVNLVARWRVVCLYLYRGDVAGGVVCSESRGFQIGAIVLKIVEPLSVKGKSLLSLIRSLVLAQFWPVNVAKVVPNVNGHSILVVLFSRSNVNKVGVIRC